MRGAQGVPRRGDRGGRGLHDADGCNGTKESTAAADLDYKPSILAAQILVERREDRYDDIAAASNALLDEWEVDGAQFIEAACNGERWGDCRLRSSQLTRSTLSSLVQTLVQEPP